MPGVARAAGLSPFHFHRVFQAMVGETLAEFVKRLRLEKALFMSPRATRRGEMANFSSRRPPSLTSVAMACGNSIVF